jgi:DNA-binding SARP family transcriptional activator
VGVVDLIDRLRRVQQRHRKPGSFIRMPDQSRRFFEQRLRTGDGRDSLDAIERSIRLLARFWSGEGIEGPTVRGVKVSSDVVELVVDGHGTVPRIPDPFTIGVGGMSLVVERSALSRPLHRGSGPRQGRFPIPTLVTAGRAVDGLVLVNLEALGSLIVEGDPSESDGVLRALALELATSHWADQFDVVLVGFGAELGRFDRVRAVTDVPALTHELWCRRFRAEALLRNANFRSFAEARCLEPNGTWDPLVVICGPSTPETRVADLIDVGSHAVGGMAVIAAGGSGEASHTLRLSTSQDSPLLELIGSVVFPQQIAVEELADLDAILGAANDRESVASSAGFEVGSPRPGRAAGPSVAFESATRVEVREVTVPVPVIAEPPPIPRDGESGTYEVEVAVLGPIEIRGAAREFTRAWAEELVVYLALHPNGASSDAWATALWPDSVMAPSSLHSTASVARRSLGQGRDGNDHLPRSHGRLALAPTVGTDWDRFVLLAATDQTNSWRSALELVRGRPFEGLRSSDWPVLEGIGPSIESTVVDLSGRLAGVRLRAGDPRGAEWAARRGLLVSPYDERLYRMLMRAADLGGNPAGVEAVMAELVRLVADDIEPLDSVHPSTMELYRSLTRRRTLPPASR